MAKLFLSLLSFFLLCPSISVARKAGECLILRINAEKPINRIRAEAGVSESWDHQKTQFRCAGVSLQRHTIQRGGLMLPAYHNFPVLAYVVQGKGIFGILIPGCPEPVEPSQPSESFSDQHQRIDACNAGDVIAFPTGAAYWIYNNGDQDLVVVALQDTSNNANQLDSNPRSFQIAGRREDANVFRGFDVETLSEAFNIDKEIARRLQGQGDKRGHIVAVKEGLQVMISPPLIPGEGIDETCSARVKENIDSQSRADYYNPRAGWLTTVNSQTLPILGSLQLSAARGVLFKNAIMAPLWFMNSNSIVYVTRGESRMQIVNNDGEAVFNGQVKEGQVVVVPQNFVVLKKGGEQGFDWVEFNTNDKAMMNTLSGLNSTLTGMPVDVIAASYQILRDQAEDLKLARSEKVFFGPARAASA